MLTKYWTLHFCGRKWSLWCRSVVADGAIFEVRWLLNSSAPFYGFVFNFQEQLQGTVPTLPHITFAPISCIRKQWRYKEFPSRVRLLNKTLKQFTALLWAVWLFVVCFTLFGSKVHMPHAWHMCRNQRTSFRNRFSPHTTWDLGTELRSQGSVASALTHWAWHPW